MKKILRFVSERMDRGVSTACGHLLSFGIDRGVATACDSLDSSNDQVIHHDMHCASFLGLHLADLNQSCDLAQLCRSFEYNQVNSFFFLNYGVTTHLPFFFVKKKQYISNLYS